MHIQFVSKGIDESPALRARIDERLTEATEKYFSRPGEAFVTATKEGFGFKVDISIHLPSGVFLQASGTGGEAYGALDDAITKVEKRLRRYKRRLKDHHADHKPELPALETPVMVLRSDGQHENLDDDDQDEDASGEFEPVIIAERAASLKTLTVGMAVTEMDAVNAPFVLFINAANGDMNIVYRRPDGHVGWIDPSQGAKGSLASKPA